MRQISADFMYNSTMKNSVIKVSVAAVILAAVFMLGLGTGTQISGPSRSSVNTEDLRENRRNEVETETSAKKDGAETVQDNGGQAEKKLSDWKQIQNEALGLTLAVPPDYYVQNPGNYGDASLEITSYDPDLAPASDLAGDAIKIEVYMDAKASGVDLNAWLSGRPTGEVENLKREARRVGNQSVVFETGYGMSGYLTYYIDRGGDVLILTAYAESQTLYEAKQVLESIISEL